MAAEKEDPRLKILEDTMYSIEKTYGKGAIMKLGDGVINKIESIHKNPSNVVITWKVSFANRSELGLSIYRFKEINNEINVTSCIYFH